ncbi:uncharacterized protein J7T54_001421 [Emericellopsis cladophorae]|uniref:Enoyl reductase (ER) domain-containing protein n=1 Tax=Emericellopsis cladophorae TaxID=2686198 RepID=A0A9Q0BEP7_9HYPO|nr:uncharacterized protein J7T54_001421 [Emericellopsis cladophorae]KAI6781459.1 hypothetical protein J7T54_001421 [Emericellopsis cladophorae]
MKAVQILGDISSPRIVTNDDMPTPSPSGSEILIKVHAAGITGDAVTWPEIYATPSRIPGHEISGTVAALGPDYLGPLAVNQEVFGMLSADRGQGQAEYAICSAAEIAPMPSSISHAEAAVLPIPLLTAWETIVDHGKITPSTKVLLTGASGAVGSVFVQLVSLLTGAHTIALASAQNHEALRKHGAENVVDYKAAGWEKSIGKFDVVFDTVGGDILTKTWDAVADDGIVVTVGDPPPAWAFGRGKAVEAETRPGVRYMHFIVSPDAERLAEASSFIHSGRMKPLAVQSFGFGDAVEGWTYAQQRNRGKKAVIVFDVYNCKRD